MWCRGKGEEGAVWLFSLFLVNHVEHVETGRATGGARRRRPHERYAISRPTRSVNPSREARRLSRLDKKPRLVSRASAWVIGCRQRHQRRHIPSSSCPTVITAEKAKLLRGEGKARAESPQKQGFGTKPQFRRAELAPSLR